MPIRPEAMAAISGAISIGTLLGMFETVYVGSGLRLEERRGIVDNMAISER